MFSLRDYESFVGKDVIDEIYRLGDPLRGSRVIHVNSTRVGGGVAEILENLMPLLREVGLDVEWKTIEGDQRFFSITKSMHNALHGKAERLPKEDFDHYEKVNEHNAQVLEDLGDADFVVIHDLHPAALIRHFPLRKGKWIWRCHIDLSTPDPFVWEFLKQFVTQYEAAVFHSEKFTRRDLMIRQFIVPPSIDPLSQKNSDMTAEEVNRRLSKLGLSMKKPIISQVGRFDRLKDPFGVISAYRQVKSPGGVVDVGRLLMGGDFMDVTKIGKEGIDCQLVLAGGLSPDDPEGQEVYKEVAKRGKKDMDIHILVLPLHSDLEINALQRASKVVLQKSLKEGFALTVSEAFWKGIPVIGGNTGGIPLQIIDGLNGFLVESVEQAAARIRHLLTNPEKAKRMGIVGKEHVKKNFLITRYVRDHLMMYATVKLIPRKLVQF